MAETINTTQAEQLKRFRELVGESLFQRIQRDVWKQFSPKAAPIDRNGNLAPLAVFAIWEDLVAALQAEAKQHTREQLWELLKNGVKWSATVTVRTDHSCAVVILRNGRRRHVQRFWTRDKAEAWADRQCVEVARGWKE